MSASRMSYTPHLEDLFCYTGRPGARRAHVAAILESEVVQVVGWPSDWEAHTPTVVRPPPYAHRHDFLRRYAGFVVAFDGTFSLDAGLNTREALRAGVPVLAFPGEPSLWWALRVEDAFDLATYWALLTGDDDYRRMTVASQRRMAARKT